jgi:hypothetical protein
LTGFWVVAADQPFVPGDEHWTSLGGIPGANDTVLAVTGHFKTSHQWAIQNQPLRGGGFIAGAGICSRGLAAS